jgi:hypothetical protein
MMLHSAKIRCIAYGMEPNPGALLAGSGINFTECDSPGSANNDINYQANLG